MFTYKSSPEETAIAARRVKKLMDDNAIGLSEMKEIRPRYLWTQLQNAESLREIKQRESIYYMLGIKLLNETIPTGATGINVSITLRGVEESRSVSILM